MKNFQNVIDILIVGAGMAGLAAACKLQKDGADVLVIDKGRGVGGRVATRTIGEATFDHGAQFMTVRDSSFAAIVNQWCKIGIVEEWYRTFSQSSEGHPHWCGKSKMTAIAKHLARNVKVLLKKRMTSLRRNPAGWRAALDDGDTVLARAVLLTPPVPQSLALLNAGSVKLPPTIKARLESIQYERCLAVMAVLDGPARIPQPGGWAVEEGPIAWIADNQMKGISTLPAVTIHANADFSAANWDFDRQESGRTLLRAAEVWLGSKVSDFQVHGWRYSKPIRVEQSPCLILNQSPPLLIAGDAFAGPRVEGAVLSGWAAADTFKTM